jgi:trimethylamine--corrinoid protein Co-methyltransferase
MSRSSSSQVAPRYHLMSQEQINEVHLASLDILENVGIRVLHPEGVGLLRDAGCWIEKENIAHIPNWLVEDCLRSVPKRLTIFNRKGEPAMYLEGDNNFYGLGTDLIYTFDLKTGETRTSVLQDVANASRMADFCQDIDFTASFALPSDVPTNSMYLRCVKAMMENTIKPIFFTAAGKEDLEFILQMAEIVAGGAEALRRKPFLIQYSEPTAPLTHSYGALSKLFLCAERGIPICYTPASLLGAAYPVTLAGAIAQANAEALSGIVLQQLKRRGAALITGWGIPAMDMRTTLFLYGSPENRLTNSAFADMYHHYGIPIWSTVGSDANVLDAQGAWEMALGILMAALDGANLIHDVGYLGQGKVGNPAAVLMGNELVSYVKRVRRGFELNKETLALDVIRSVGPGGNYLSERHTVNHFRKELWRPTVANRDNMEIWVEKGSKSYEQRLNEEALRILDTHQPEPLPPEITARLQEISTHADEVLSEIEFVA